MLCLMWFVMVCCCVSYVGYVDGECMIGLIVECVM